ncbi:MAG: MATE family efflux transporter [Deltaproteobacteria bacterium]|nr:MATE family efflux transporter [Deltaproteobacteria bacterium]
MNSAFIKNYSLELKQTLRLAFPIMLNQVGQLMFGVLDSVMIGRVGAVPLAASAFSNALFWFCLIFGIGVSNAISTLTAQAAGAAKPRDCGEVLRHGLVVNLVIGILLAGLLHLFTYHLDVFRQTPEIIEESRTFLILIGWSGVFVLLFQNFRQFAEGLNQTKPAMIMLGLGLLMNAFLNWLWIYGNWGFKAYGLTGAGFATLVSRGVFTIMMMIYIIRSPLFTGHMPLKWWKAFERRWMASILKLGLPGGFQYLFEVGAFTFAAMMMGWIGATELAAHQIAINLASITFMFAVGLATAASIRGGYAAGKGNYHEARRVGFSSIILGAGGMSIFGLIFYFFREQLPRIYIHDVSVVHLASQLLIVAACFQVFDGIQGVCVGALRGLSDVKIPTIVSFFAYWVLSLPLGYYLGFHLNYGAIGLWTGLAIGLAVSAVLLTIRFHIISKKLCDV